MILGLKSSHTCIRCHLLERKHISQAKYAYNVANSHFVTTESQSPLFYLLHPSDGYIKVNFSSYIVTNDPWI